jgi:hypothetical protein
MATQFRTFAFALALGVVCLSSFEVRAEVSVAPVQAALGGLESWLGDGANGKTWSAYLNLPSLHAELAKGDKADPAVIAAVQKKLDSGAAGLELGPFAKLRDALAQWSAELAIASAPGLPEATLQAEAAFRPISDADLAADKTALEAAVAKLDRYLKSGGANGAAWREYLRWQDLDAQLKTDKPEVDTLKSVSQRFAADQVGLELPVFAGVAAPLERYVNDLTANKEDLKTQYATQLKTLSDELKQYAAGQNDELALGLGGRLGWLESMRQATPLVNAIRKRYSQPNLHVRASHRLVGAGIARPVDEVTPVNDVILGTNITGIGRTVGKVDLKLVPATDKATLDTVLSGKVHSRTVGRNGPATIHSNGITEIEGRKRIVIDERGLASYPATATAKTTTTITGIAAGRSGSGMVQRIATKKVYEAKPEAEQVGSQHAAARVKRRVEEEAAVGLGKAHWNYVNKVRNPLLRRREFPSLFRLSTTDDSLFVIAQQANRFQIGAPDNPPSVTVENDLAVQVHESMVNNFAAALLGGVTLKEEEVQKQATELLGELPERLKSEIDRDPWSITFAKIRPVTIHFADNGFQVTVRGQRYTSGDRDFQAMNVTADYKIEADGGGFRLVRKDELQIEPPNFVKGKSLSGRQIALKTLLEKRFGKMLDKEVKSKGLVLPGRWREAGRLDPKQLQSGGGWLVAAWVESGEPAPPEVKDKVKVAKSDRALSSR